MPWITESRSPHHPPSLDHLVGAADERLQEREPEDLHGLEVEDEVEAMSPPASANLLNMEIAGRRCFAVKSAPDPHRDLTPVPRPSLPRMPRAATIRGVVVFAEAAGVQEGQELARPEGEREVTDHVRSAVRVRDREDLEVAAVF
jgi:hypothetical protein